MPVQQPVQVVDDRIEGAVGMVRGTVQRQARRALSHHTLGQRAHQARFANPRLAAEQHHLAQTVAGLGPALQQQRHLRLPAHQGGEPAGGGHVQATLRGAFPHHLGDPHRRVNALERMHPPVLADKVPLHQASGGLTEHHRIRLCQALQAGGQVRRVAQGQAFAPVATADVAHHHRPGMDTQAHGQVHPLVLDQPRVQHRHGLYNAQSGAHGALRIVFVGLRIAKVDEQAVAQILRDRPGKALDDGGAGGVVGTQHLAQVFGIELPGEAGRVGQIAEHHGELAAFGVGRRGGGRQGRRVDRWRFLSLRR